MCIVYHYLYNRNGLVGGIINIGNHLTVPWSDVPSIPTCNVTPSGDISQDHTKVQSKENSKKMLSILQMK